MYAVLKTGGKQYTVKENDTVQIGKVDAAAGEEIVLGEVLFLHTDDGPVIGTPLVQGAKVTGKVVRHIKGEKVTGFTFKPKKNEHRRYGHRQDYTQVLIQKIAVG